MRYLAWAKDPFGKIFSISGTTEEEVRKSAEEKGWQIVSGRYGSTPADWPEKPEEKITPPPGFTPETMPPTQYLKYEPEKKRYVEPRTGLTFSLETYRWEEPEKPEEKITPPPGFTPETMPPTQYLKYEPEKRRYVEPQTGLTFSLETQRWEEPEKTFSFFDILSNLQKEIERYKTKWEKAKKDLETTIKMWEQERKLNEENPFLPQSAINKENEKIDNKYQKKVEDLIIDYSDIIPTFEPEITEQLNKMAKAGFPIETIKKTIQGIVASKVSPLKLELEKYGRYLEPLYQKKYLETLTPYSEFVEKRIEELKGAPAGLKEFYFGEEGYLKQLRKQAEKEIEMINERMNKEIADLKDFYDLSVQSAKTNLNSRLLEIEEKRQSARNYLIGQLAKLGALNTTGASAVAVNELEAKYDKMKAELQQRYDLALQEKALQYQQMIRKYEAERDEKISKIISQVDKKEEQIRKELFEYELKNDEKISKLMDKYINKVIDLQKYALKEAKTGVADYLKDFYKTVSTIAETDLLDRVMPSIIDFKAEETNLKRQKDLLNIAKIKASMGRTVSKEKTVPFSLSALKAGIVGLPISQAEEILSSETPPAWFLTQLGKEKGVSYLPTSKIAKEEWDKVRKRALEGLNLVKKEEVVATKPEVSMVRNWIYNQLGWTKDDIDKLKTDEEFFHWALRKAKEEIQLEKTSPVYQQFLEEKQELRRQLEKPQVKTRKILGIFPVKEKSKTELEMVKEWAKRQPGFEEEDLKRLEIDKEFFKWALQKMKTGK